MCSGDHLAGASVSPYPKVKITWDDAALEANPWYDIGDFEDGVSAAITTVGFLVKSGPKWYTLAMGFDMANPEKVHAVFHIPRGCVVKVEPL